MVLSNPLEKIVLKKFDIIESILKIWLEYHWSEDPVDKEVWLSKIKSLLEKL